MDLQQAKDLLQVSEPLCTEDIRRQYRRAALKHHPDKGGDSATFLLVCEAHDVLQDSIGKDDIAERDYSSLLQDFLQATMVTCSQGPPLVQCIASILASCKNATQSLSALCKMDSGTCLRVLSFLEKHAELLHISEKDIAMIRTSLGTECKPEKEAAYTLKAGIDHLLQARVFRLQHEGDELMVPLWHEHLVFDSNGTAIHVTCDLELPEEVHLDEYNDVHIKATGSLCQIFSEGEMRVELGETKWSIPASDLRISKTQVHRIRGKGVPRISVQDVYNDQSRADVVVHITLGE